MAQPLSHGWMKDCVATGAALGLGLAGLACVQWHQLAHAHRKAGGRDKVWACFEHRPALQRARVLVLGDSTGVGIGAATPGQSLAGLLADEFPNAEVVNASRAGARLADVLRQCREGEWNGQSFDVVLLHAGGNDVLRMTPWKALTADADELLERLRTVGRRTIWLGIANIGLSPLFIAPFSWWMSARTRKASHLFAACSRKAGVEFVSFFHERRDDPFSREYAKYFSPDGLHPSSDSYRYCYEAIKRETQLKAALSAAAERRRQPRAAGRGARAHPVQPRPAEPRPA